MAGRITKRVVDATKAAESDVIVWDGELRGFGLRVKPSGAKSYLLQYRNAEGRSRRYTIGRHGVLTADQARDKAVKLLGEITDGADPAENKRRASESPTVNDLVDQYLAEARADGSIKASTLAMDESRIEAHVRPLLGTRKVDHLTAGDIRKFVRDVEDGKTARREKLGPRRVRIVKGGSGAAGRTLGMLHTILQLGVRDSVISSNPAAGVRKPKATPYRPKLELDSYQELGKVLVASVAKARNPTALAAIRLLAVTGCRRDEILRLKWSEVDEPSRCFWFEDTKSGAQIRPIGKAAFTILRKLSKDGDLVLPATRGERHFQGLPRIWRAIVADMGMQGLHLHALRHWFASTAAALGYSELTIAGMLGHRVKGVTGRYANTPDAALVAAADKVSRHIARALDGTKTGQVVEFPGGQAGKGAA